jgi:hypothetical protein
VTSDGSVLTTDDRDVGAGPEPPAADLLEELGRHLRAADVLLAGLAEDMAAAGARTATERAERARAELTAALAIARRMLETTAGP